MKFKIHTDKEFRHSGENKACEILISLEHKYICRNFHTGFTEIDIITLKDDVFHFVEVKEWKQSFVSPVHALQKTAGLRRKAALLFLSCLKEEPAIHADFSQRRHITELLTDPYSVAMSFDLLWIHNTGHNYEEGIF